ncbi:MAG: ABC transporter permease [Alphaproteobacteria bacterium]
MSPVLTIAGQEIRDGLRDRWVVAATVLMAVLALSLVLMGSAPAGNVKTSPLAVAVVSLASLSIFLVPLIALLLSHDAIVGETERGTILLLLSYPVARWQLLTGKFLGQMAIITFATVLGYGVAGLAVEAMSADGGGAGRLAFLVLLASSIALGAVFVGFGYLISVSVRERGTAAGLAVAVWLVFVVLYDTALLGVLVTADIPAWALNTLLLLNPADVYRLLNLTGFEEVRYLSGMAGLSVKAGLGGAALVGALLAWLAVPLAIAAARFGRREL